MWSSTIALAGVLASMPWADQVVVGVLDAAPEIGVSALLDETAVWLRAHTALSMVAGDQVGLDRETLSRCPADRLYTCLARAILEVPSRPRAGVMIARARADGVQLLVFDAAALAPILAAQDVEGQVYAHVLRVSGRTTAEALDGLRATVGFEAPARASIEARGCDGCVVRIAQHDAPIVGDPSIIDGLRVRAGSARVEVSSAGEVIAAATVTLVADRASVVRIDVPAQTGWWRPVLASGLVVTGGVALGTGVAIATSRGDVLCVSRSPTCMADPSASGDPRAEDYASARTTAQVLAVSGALVAAAGLVLWGLELLRDETPRLTVE